MSFALPMFPLGSVLFPHMLLPLRIFEPRYQTLVDDCLASDRRFGVVLIERGSEVGGGDSRFRTGTIAKIAGVADLDDGQRLILAVGTSRCQVTDWLPDDPYPRALVDELDDRAEEESVEHVNQVEHKLRRTLALMSEAGYDVGDTSFHVSGDTNVAVQQLCALAPVSVLDAQVLLSAATVGEQLNRLEQFLDEGIDSLLKQLASG